MRVLLTVSALAVALAGAPAAAAPVARIVSGPPVFHHFWQGGERHALWRNREGDRYAWRRDHRDRRDGGNFAGSAGEADEFGPEAAGSALFVSTPVFVDVTLAPAAGPAPVEWVPGPKIIEVGRSAPPRRPLPLVIYGD